QPLADGDSHRLVRHILRKLPDVPGELVNGIVARAEGNPFYVEELVKVLIEDGMIIPDKETWRLRADRPQRLRIPPTLTGVLQARLDRLSTLERTTLQKAAVVGRIFWDYSVRQMRDETGHVLTENETLIALQALEQRELIFRRQSSVFAGTQAYVFKHAILRDVAYESVLLRQRPIYHKQAADWLVDQSGDRVAEYASAIAEHYELAGEYVDAARLYGMAAEQAQERYNAQLAIDYYRKVLLLLAEHPELTADLLQTQEKLGYLLEQQARLVEAAQIYMLMRHTAELDGDLEAQVRACNGLAAISQFQANYVSVLGHVAQAEQIAWLVNAELKLVDAQLHKARAFANLRQPVEGLAAANQALALSQKLAAPRQLIDSLALLCRLYMQLGQQDELSVSLGQLQQETARWADVPERQGDQAHGLVSLGRLYLQIGRVQRASRYLLDGLRRYRTLDDSRGVSETLDALGELARLQGKAPAAVQLHRQALQLIDSIGTRYGRLQFQANLAAALLRQAAYQEAAALLRRVVVEAEDVARVVNWWGLGQVHVLLAEALLGQAELEAAKTAVLRAHELATTYFPATLPTAWRVLGRILAQTGERTAVNGQMVAAEDAFLQSIRWLRAHGGLDGLVEQVALLQDWAAFENGRGQAVKAAQLRQRASALAERLGLGAI
ncbi:MAG: tetratricopeptide repeat protein, partial [Anaerolineales bacterium]|nr:tetratricopeptide repeat protein [Anaerolineales bacterium]